MPPTLELRTKQSLALTPRLQQSVRLLQLSSLEFQQELRNALDTNPFLEYDESQTEDNALGNDNGSSMTESTPRRHERRRPKHRSPPKSHTDTSRQRRFRVARRFDGRILVRSVRPRRRRATTATAKAPIPADWVRIEPSLHETLHDTLRLYPLNDRDRAVAQLIIEALDDDGYLRQELSELAEARRHRTRADTKTN